MRVLIDTHTFLWFVSSPLKLNRTALLLVGDDTTHLQISIASIWEISIKSSRGKLSVNGGFKNVENRLVENGIEILPIIFAHTFEHNSLPFHHKDPFDRMIAAQAIFEGIDLVSEDDVFDLYFAGTNVKRIW